MIQIENYNVSIYGDGRHEYDGYYLVTIDEFDKHDNPTQRKKAIYVKADSVAIIEEFLIHLICESGFRIDLFGNYEKILIKKQIIWEVHSK
jgi:hypothetical protein